MHTHNRERSEEQRRSANVDVIEKHCSPIKPNAIPQFCGFRVVYKLLCLLTVTIRPLFSVSSLRCSIIYDLEQHA